MSSAGPSSSASVAAAALLPVPNSLDSFLSSVRMIASGAPGGGTFGAGDLVDFAARAMEMLQRAPPINLLNAVDTLDGARNSFGVAALLSCCLRHASAVTDWVGLFNRTVIFIGECDAEQIKMAPNTLAELCHHFTDELIRRKTPMLGLHPLLQALPKLQPSPRTLTSAHSDLCKLCLAAKCLTPVLRNCLDVDFNDVSREAAVGDSRYILLYYYYGGMILAAVKNYSRALYFFEVCVTIPAVAVSYIMLEAFKKYLLVSLIVQGHKPKDWMNLPKYTSPTVIKYFKQLTTPYHELVAAYYSNKKEQLQAVIGKFSETFANDGNSGLVAQVAQSQAKTNIKRLTKTFLTLSLGELANHTGLQSTEEAEKVVVHMIQEGSIRAKISQQDGMVRFDAGPTELYNSSHMLESLERQLRACIRLDTQIASLDEEILLNPTYVKRSSAAAASTSGSAAVASSSVAAADEDDSIKSGVAGGGGGAAGMNGVSSAGMMNALF